MHGSKFAPSTTCPKCNQTIPSRRDDLDALHGQGSKILPAPRCPRCG